MTALSVYPVGVQVAEQPATQARQLELVSGIQQPSFGQVELEAVEVEHGDS